MREGLAADIDFDPSYKRQRDLARYMLGLAINKLRGRRSLFSPDQTAEEIGRALHEMAIKEGIVSFDEWHHAPACRANNWSKMALPTGPCTCGAEARRIR